MTEIPDDVMKAAKEIAEIANNCCYRSDGYEEDIADRIARAILAERERDRWLPIESAPKDGRQVLACFVGQFEKLAVFVAMANPDKVYAHGYADPTHWQPLPEPPKNNA